MIFFGCIKIAEKKAICSFKFSPIITSTTSPEFTPLQDATCFFAHNKVPLILF
jgi:hypothetical protein